MVLSILIINFNGKAVLGPCLESIFQQKPSFDFDVILIDNASADTSLDDAYAIQRQGYPLTIVKNSDNVGFSKANNQAAQLATGEFLWLLNNDTLLFEPDTLEKLLGFAQSQSYLGACSPILLNADHSIQFNPRRPQFLVGAAFLIQRALYLSLGGLDENFLFYTEDLDLSKRIVKQKLLLLMCTDVRIIHLGGQSTAFHRPKALIEGYRGGLYFAYKHYPSLIAHLYRILLGVFVLILSSFYGLISVVVPTFKPQAHAFWTIFLIVLKKEWVSPTGRF